MPTAGAFIARLAEVAISNAVATDPLAATYVAVEKVNSPKFGGTNDTAESKSNDSGGVKERLRTWGDASLTFELIADEAAVGQEHCWTAFGTGEIRAFRLRPKGDNAGVDKEILFLGIIDAMDEPLDKDDVGKVNVTVKRTGPMTRRNQP